MSIEAMKQALDALEHEAQKGNDDAYRVERDALRAAIEQAEKQNERIASLENTCYALIGKLQVASLKIVFRDLRPELEHHAARILNEEFGEKK